MANNFVERVAGRLKHKMYYLVVFGNSSLTRHKTDERCDKRLPGLDLRDEVSVDVGDNTHVASFNTTDAPGNGSPVLSTTEPLTEILRANSCKESSSAQNSIVVLMMEIVLDG